LLSAVGPLVGALAAQSITVSVGRSASDYREYDSPVVLGAGVTVPVSGWLGARADVRRHADDQRWLRSTCTGLIPPQSEVCRDDVFTSSYSLTSIAAGPWISVPVASRLHLEGALMVARSWFDGEWTGRDTGATIGRAPRESHWGVAAVLGASWRVSPHVAATLLARRESPQVNRCVSDTYDPFCDGGAFRSLEIGLVLIR
jgi:hypothetical protein